MKGIRGIRNTPLFPVIPGEDQESKHACHRELNSMRLVTAKLEAKTEAESEDGKDAEEI